MLRLSSNDSWLTPLRFEHARPNDVVLPHLRTSGTETRRSGNGRTVGRLAYSSAAFATRPLHDEQLDDGRNLRLDA